MEKADTVGCNDPDSGGVEVLVVDGKIPGFDATSGT